MSKIESGKLEIENKEFSINKMLSDIAVIIQPKAEENKLQFDVVLKNVVHDRVKGDEMRIKQVTVSYTHLDVYKRQVEQSTIYVKENSMYLLLIKDITEDENQQKKSNEMRAETVEVTQEVINKQMRVAQEIASLLGETTAETKLALTKLKNYIQESEDERIY